MHCQNVCVVFNFAEIVHTRNQFYAKFKAFTVHDQHEMCFQTESSHMNFIAKGVRKVHIIQF